METNSIDTTRVRQFLESYGYHQGLLRGNRYAREYFDRYEEDTKELDEYLIKAAMMRVREFVFSLPDCREKMFLYYRYLKGHSVEACAEIMALSRRTAFRLAKKALVLAAENHIPE